MSQSSVRLETVQRPVTAQAFAGRHLHDRHVTGTTPRRTPADRPSMTDVAALAGVSHQTVSRVLNNQPNVSERTRARVTAAIAHLGYRPNRAARTLATGHAQILGAVAHNITLHGPASLLAAFEQAAAEHGMSVAVASVADLDQDTLTRAISRHLDQGVAGILVIAPVTATRRAIHSLPADTPLISIDDSPTRPLDGVTIDHVEGARLATQHLLDAGHRNVWHVAGPSDWFDSALRMRGWRQTLEAAGIHPPPVVPADWSAASGYRAGQILARIPDVTAVFAASDHVALGVMRALNENGRAVPRDVSVVGCDDVTESAHFTPPLTTLRPDFRQAAQHALRLLLARLEAPGRAPEHVVITPRLIDRASVARPAAA